jgi:hypothetical protein
MTGREGPSGKGGDGAGGALPADDASKEGEPRAGKSGLPIHDSLFKHLLGRAETAGRFLHARLPPHLAQHLASAPPQILPGSFVDPDLRQSHTDVLLQIRLRNSGNVLVYCLLEHKSRPDRLVRMQLARYIMRILMQWYYDDPDGPMPAVLPVIVHNGPRPWNQPTELRELAGPVPEVIQRHLLSLDHVVVDLSLIDDAALSEDLRLRAGLMALKHGTRDKPDLIARLDIVLADVPRLELLDSHVILKYISECVEDIALVEACMQRIAPDRAQELIHPIWHAFIEQGRRQVEAKAEAAVKRAREDEAQARVEAQAEAQARAEAEAAKVQAEAAKVQAEAAKVQAEEDLRQTLAATLLGLAEQRFPPVPAAAQAYILGARAPALQGWLARILTAPTLDALLGTGADEHGAHPPGT